MIELLAQNRLLSDQFVFFAKQGIFSGKSLAQADFRAPMPYQLAFIARDRTALGC